MDSINKQLRDAEHIQRSVLRALGFKRKNEYRYDLVLTWGSGCELHYETTTGSMYLEEIDPSSLERKYIYLRDTKDQADFIKLVNTLKQA